MARRELREEHEDRGRNPPPPLPIRYSSLPTLGILVTAMLLLPIAWSLLSNLNLRPETAEALKIRVFPSKQGEDKKAGAKQRDQSPREVGTVWQSLAEYQKRLGYLDVRGKQQAFLSIWAVTNLFQAALTVVVFAVSIKTLLLFTPPE